MHIFLKETQVHSVNNNTAPQHDQDKIGEAHTTKKIGRKYKKIE
jgi:hypothetical protein